MSESFAFKLFKNLVLTPTTKVIKESSGQLVPSLGIINVLPLMVEGSMVHLNFYIFDTWDFDLLDNLLEDSFMKVILESYTFLLEKLLNFQ